MLNESIGSLSPDERRLRVTDKDRMSTMDRHRNSIYLEVGVPRRKGHGNMRWDEIDVAWRVEIYWWKRDEFEVREFEEFRPALDFLLDHAGAI